MADLGWIKLHRELLDKAIWQCSTTEQKTILITLLLMANHDQREWEWEGKKFKCVPGQFVTSIKSIAIKAGVTNQNVRTALVRFEKYEFLTNQSTKTGRLITIVNWGLYQCENNLPNIAPNKDLTKTSQSAHKALTPNKNDKNDKNEKNVRNILKGFSTNEVWMDTFEDFIAMRKTIKKPMTERAIKLTINNLNKISSDENIQIKILEQSIMNSWQGVFPLKEYTGTPKNRNSKDGNNANVQKGLELLEKYENEEEGGKSVWDV
jgi:hypothetical protein